MAEETIELVKIPNAFNTADFSNGQVLLLGYTIGDGHPFIGKTLNENGD